MAQEYSIIVVEDEKLLAKNIAKNIEKANSHFKVVEIFGNGEDAYNYILKNPPHVVFMDIRMPIVDGIELLKRIYESHKFIHCVILTGYSDFEYAQTAVKYSAFDYLLKPVNPQELSTTLSKIELSFLAAGQKLHKEDSDDYRKPEEIVNIIKEHIKNNYANVLDLNSIAHEFGFSPSYLTKIFTKYEQITPSKYIRNYRMNIAKQLLTLPGSTINSVASAVGYPDPFHFSKTFKQTFGYSPTSYKEKNS